MASAVINRITICRPGEQEALAFYNTDVKVHRQTVKALARKGYEIVEDKEDLANIQNADEALVTAQHFLPLK